ncbi:chemotaxis signal transduction protein [Thermovibrio guaymasensis]|uniref:Chemotaxis signal transduction protein n=1 Tax=Thermovibrio guaymasensis TaxID=240167 RepID=A0A420W679_9BACT|nr:chemotaxis protein CheW [Thermovibrio guaymasensis]RKQ60611.1 chemotaxis signal transduction protein [Thermovibrio guaymasensis]
MKENILVVRIGKEFLAIKAKNIKSIIEVDQRDLKINSSLSSHTLGFVKHYKNIYPLISPSILFNKKNPSLDSLFDKNRVTVVIIQIDSKAYALPVTQVITIEEAKKVEIENSEVSVFALRNGFVEELNVKIFENLKVPFLNLKSEREKLEKSQQRKKSYYLEVTIEGKKFCIDARLVRKVVELDSISGVRLSDQKWISEVYSVGGEAIKAGNLKKLLEIEEKTKEKFLVILEKNKKTFALVVDKVEDIIEITEDKKTKSFKSNDILSDFINTNNDVIPLISSSFLEEILEKESTAVHKKEEHKKESSEEENTYLIVKIGNVRIGIELKNVKKLVRSENTRVTSYRNLGGIVQVGQEIFPILNIANELDEKIRLDLKRADYLIVEKDNRNIAIPISQVEGLTKTSTSQITGSNKRNIFSKAIVDENGEALSILNTDLLLRRAYES